MIPSGPTVQDEMANLAFWLGAMTAFDDIYHNITDLIEFDQVKSNFITQHKIASTLSSDGLMEINIHQVS